MSRDRTASVPEDLTGQPRRVAVGGGLRHAFRALRHRNFRLFFYGQLVSLIGTWMQQAALSWLVYRAAGVLAVSDPVKESTEEAIAHLHALGIKVTMLTGDNERTARAVAQKLGIDEVEAGAEPQHKHARVRKLREGGHVVAMAGDGINDAPALAAAGVGIAMGTGTDVAMESAGITLLKGDLRGIEKTIRLSRSMMSNIRQNLFFAFIYNAAGIPIAAGLLYPIFGLLLSSMIAGAAMSLISVSVIANALRLRNTSL